MRLPVAVLTIALVAALAPPAGAQAPERVRVETPPGASILVHGEYPPTQSSCVEPTQPLLHERYRGNVEVLRASDGSLTLIGELPFEDYLKGIAEVPRSWPVEALKAQVVAARSYATVQMEREDSTLYDLCATDACQVYMGMGIEAGAWGERWVRAVEETEGEVLLHDERPAETFYFSTSNGRTYTNQEVWGSDPLPYLPSITEEDDGGSPLSRWRTEVPFDDLAKLLRPAHWGTGPITEARARDGVVVLRGPGEARERLDLAHLRDALNATSRCRMPDRYPPTDDTGYRLPLTVPSKWYEPRVEGDRLILEGRGWGHGIGMVQWGAKGKADLGLGYADILATYYGGLRPQPYEGPGTIRVLLATGLTAITIVPEGEVTLAGADRPPPWRLTPTGKGVRLRRGEPPAPELEITRLRAFAPPGEEAGVTFRSSHDVRARIEFLGGEELLVASPWFSRGDGRVALRSTPPAGAEALRVRATNGVDTIVTDAVAPALVAAPTAAPSPSPPSAAPSARQLPADGGFPWLPVGLGLVIVALVVLASTRRRRVHYE